MKKLIEICANPSGLGTLDENENNVGTGVEQGPSGDLLQIQIRVDTHQIIEQAVFNTFGSGPLIAMSSVLTERIKGRTVDEASAMQTDDIATELGLHREQRYDVPLVDKVLRAAILDYKSKRK